jgi:hypothetical protein
MLQLTDAVLVDPVTVAASERVCDGVRVPVVGLFVTLIAEAVRLIVALAVRRGFMRLRAVTVTVCGDVMVDGAVYRPAVEIVPRFVPLRDQVTRVSAWPVTVAVNCCCCATLRIAFRGATLTVSAG